MNAFEQLIWNANRGAGHSEAFQQMFDTDNYKNVFIPKMAQQVQAAMQPIHPAPAPAPPAMSPNLQEYMQKLTGQASNALYGGILGYNPQPMTAPNGTQFAPPQGNFRDPYGQMQGILGQAQPQQGNPYGKPAYGGY